MSDIPPETPAPEEPSERTTDETPIASQTPSRDFSEQIARGLLVAFLIIAGLVLLAVGLCFASFPRFN